MKFINQLEVLLHEDVCDKHPFELPRLANGVKFNQCSSNGVERKFKMHFHEDTSTEWLVLLHDAIMNDTFRLLSDIGNEDGAYFQWSLQLKMIGKQEHSNVNPQIYLTTAPRFLNKDNLFGDLHNEMRTLVHKIERYGQRLFGWSVHQLISIEASISKIDTKQTGPYHIHHDGCLGNMMCHFPPHSAPSFEKWDV